MFKDIYDDDVSLHSGIPTKFSHLQNKIFSDWEIPPWELYIDKNKLIGEGSWSYVYLAEWRKTTVVAKVLKDSFDNHAKELIIKEFKNMTKMHHPNIVQLFGYVNEPFIIVMEYFKNGDLFYNIKNLSYKLKLKITKDILKGLIYIHERKPNSLIHRDIKPRNILLTDSYTAKIADFGLSTFTINTIVNNIKTENIENIDNIEYTNNVGTERYMAPEANSSNYDNKIDIYSCGILLYELFTSLTYIKNYNLSYMSINNKELKNLILKMSSKISYDRPSALETYNIFNNIKFKNKNLFTFKKIST